MRLRNAAAACGSARCAAPSRTRFSTTSPPTFTPATSDRYSRYSRERAFGESPYTGAITSCAMRSRRLIRAIHLRAWAVARRFSPEA